MNTTDHTVSGLLRKRADLFNKATRLRDRMVEIKNDIDALDRTMRTFGYDGDLDAAMPRQKRQVMFGAGELPRAILRELRDADSPISTRELAQSIVALRGDDARDRRLVTDVSNLHLRLLVSIARPDAYGLPSMRRGICYGPDGSAVSATNGPSGPPTTGRRILRSHSCLASVAKHRSARGGT